MMKRHTFKWRIFKYHIAVIIIMMILVGIIFNIAIRLFIEKDIINQLNKIATHTEAIALKKGPQFLPKDAIPPPKKPPDIDYLDFYFRLDRSLREPLSVLNADYILLDEDKQIIKLFPEEYYQSNFEVLNAIDHEIKASIENQEESYYNFELSGDKYISIIKPVSEKNTFGLGWIIIYSSLEKINQWKLSVNSLLLMILICSAFITLFVSSVATKRISALFSSLTDHIRYIAERDFEKKLPLPDDEELKSLVLTFNMMSEKLNSYDQAQKTFLQNISHEFRTPLTSIQSYAEGLKYDVIDQDTAYTIIIDETKRMTELVENLLYLSRLDAIDEVYDFQPIDLKCLLKQCVDRLNGMALIQNIQLILNIKDDLSWSYNGDVEKLSRAFTNIITNCMRYAKSTVYIALEIIDSQSYQIKISDDGPGFLPEELPYIFQRFYKGEKGNNGLGLTISQNIIEKHGGNLLAYNNDRGAEFLIQMSTSS